MAIAKFDIFCKFEIDTSIEYGFSEKFRHQKPF